MALQRTIWRPDTCQCVVIYEWDDSVPQEQRVHTPVREARKRVAVIDDAATAVAQAAHDAKRDAAHQMVADKLGVTVAALREQALAAGIVLPMEWAVVPPVRVFQDTDEVVAHAHVCKEHGEHMFDIVAMHAAVSAENSRKNLAVSKAAEVLGVESSEVGWALELESRDVLVTVPNHASPAKVREVEQALGALGGKPVTVTRGPA